MSVTRDRPHLCHVTPCLCLAFSNIFLRRCLLVPVHTIYFSRASASRGSVSVLLKFSERIYFLFEYYLNFSSNIISNRFDQ